MLWMDLNTVKESLSLLAENIMNLAKMFNKWTQGMWDVIWGSSAIQKCISHLCSTHWLSNYTHLQVTHKSLSLIYPLCSCIHEDSRRTLWWRFKCSFLICCESVLAIFHTSTAILGKMNGHFVNLKPKSLHISVSD